VRVDAARLDDGDMTAIAALVAAVDMTTNPAHV
jgi:hypothetical protein